LRRVLGADFRASDKRVVQLRKVGLLAARESSSSIKFFELNAEFTSHRGLLAQPLLEQASHQPEPLEALFSATSRLGIERMRVSCSEHVPSWTAWWRVSASMPPRSCGCHLLGFEPGPARFQ